MSDAVHTVVTDIEGTTSSLSFVRDVLFPYARERLRRYVIANSNDPRIASVLDDVRKLEGNAALGRDEIISLLLRFSDEDRKVSPLKALQGYIWADGYRTGAFHAHVYEDALTFLRKWHARGLRLCVYSSGSVAAQKLFFGHTEVGDLTGLFSAFFDTTTGSKGDGASYRSIASLLHAEPSGVAFVSDSVSELDAARSAGMATMWVNRGYVPIGEIDHPNAHTFADVDTWLLGRTR